MSLREHANQTIKHLEEQLSLERQRSAILVEALRYIAYKDWFNGQGEFPRDKAIQALKKYEEIK